MKFKKLLAAILSVVMVLSLLPVTAMADSHSHKDPTGVDVEFLPWESGNSLPAEGSYYLTGNVELSDDWKIIGKTVNLCLNDKVINLKGKEVIVQDGGNLSLYDCGKGTTRYYQKLESGQWKLVESQYSGATEGCTTVGGVITGGSFDVEPSESKYDGATFTMLGGNIVGNTSTDGAIYVGGKSTFTMYDGKICGNTSAGGYGGANGGAVYARYKMFMYGGMICDNVSEKNGGGVCNGGGEMIMLGGTITRNTCGEKGGGIYNVGTLTIGGTAVVSDNRDKNNKSTDVVGTIALSTDTKPKAGMKIGLYGADTKVTGASAGDEQYFFASSSDNYVKYDSSALVLGVVDTSKTITLSSCENGTVTFSGEGVAVNADKTIAPAGTTVTVTAIPEDCYELGKLTVSGDIGDITEAMSFTMPSDNVTVTAEFKMLSHVHKDADGKNVAFKPWDKTDSLPTEGNYYLTDNVTLSDTHTVTGTLKLCLNDMVVNLNGKNITVDGGNLTLYDCGKTTRYYSKAANGLWTLVEDKSDATEGCTTVGGVITGGDNTSSSGGTVIVNSGAFTMTGGNIAGNKVTYFGGGVLNKGTFTMTGGTIAGNFAGNEGGFGGGVYNKGTFTMTGGSITGNATTFNGGGVYNNTDCTFTMTGGSITGNKITASEGGGIHNKGTLSIGGTAVVTGNLKGTTPNDVENGSGKTITIDGTTKPKAGMKVGLVGTNTVVNGAAETDKQYFFSDDGAKKVVYKDSKIQLAARDAGTAWYIDEDGKEVELAAGNFITQVDKTSIVTWDGTPVYVNGNVTITSRVMMSADTKLILADGASLTINSGINGSNKTLTVYRQTHGTGTLTVNSTTGNGVTGNVTVNGGIVTITTSTTTTSSAGVQGAVTVNGGSVTITGGSNAYGVKGTVTVNSGNATISGNNSGVEGAVTVNDGSVTITGVGKGVNGNVTVSGGSVEISGTGSDLDGIGIQQGVITVTGDGVLTVNGASRAIFNIEDTNVTADVKVSTDGATYTDWDGETALNTYKYLKLTAPHVHSFVNGVCSICEYNCQHSFVDHVCEHCGMKDTIYAAEFFQIIGAHKYVNENSVKFNLEPSNNNYNLRFDTVIFLGISADAKLSVTSYGYQLIVNETFTFDFYMSGKTVSKVKISGMTNAARNGEYALLHTVEQVIIKAPTCTENGIMSTYWVCKDGCGKVFTDNTCKTEIPADAVATYETSVVLATGHDFTYSAEGGTLKAKCWHDCDKGYDEIPMTLTLTTDVAANAAAVKAWNDAGAATATLSYYAANDTGFATPLTTPVKSGKYVAKVTAGDKTATLENIEYVSPYWYTNDKNEKVELDEIPTIAENKTGDETWSGTVIVPAGQTIKIDGKVTLSDNTTIILADGASLEITGGITGGKNLNIYGQTNGTGKLIVNNSGSAATSIIGVQGNVIVGGGDVTISATNTGSGSAYGTSGGSVTVGGGKVAISGTGTDTSNAVNGTGRAISVSGDGVLILSGSTQATNVASNNITAKVQYSEADDGTAYDKEWTGTPALTSYNFLKLTAPHTHEFTYSAEGAILTATCADKDGNCKLTDKKTTVTLTAEDAKAGTTYSGAAVSSTDLTAAAVTKGDVTYYVKGGSVAIAAPSEAGYYTAKVTLTDAKGGTYDLTKDFVLYTTEIDGTHYATLADAIAAAQNGDTITLSQDVTITEQLVIDKAITFDGNNKTITRTPNTGAASTRAGILVKAGATIKNLTVSGPNSNTSGWDNGEFGIKLYNADGAVLEDVTVKDANAGIQVNGGSVTMKGDITVSGNEFGGIELCKGGALDISGATLVNNSESDANPALWNDDGKGEITFSEGQNAFIEPDAEKDHFYLSGAAKLTSSGKDTYYRTLEDALAAAQNGDTVTLLDDVTTKGLTVPAGVTLDLNNKTVTPAEDGFTGISNKGTVKVYNENASQLAYLLYDAVDATGGKYAAGEEITFNNTVIPANAEVTAKQAEDGKQTLEFRLPDGTKLLWGENVGAGTTVSVDGVLQVNSDFTVKGKLACDTLTNPNNKTITKDGGEILVKELDTAVKAAKDAITAAAGDGASDAVKAIVDAANGTDAAVGSLDSKADPTTITSSNTIAAIKSEIEKISKEAQFAVYKQQTIETLSETYKDASDAVKAIISGDTTISGTAFDNAKTLAELKSSVDTAKAAVVTKIELQQAKEEALEDLNETYKDASDAVKAIITDNAATINAATTTELVATAKAAIETKIELQQTKEDAAKQINEAAGAEADRSDKMKAIVERYLGANGTITKATDTATIATLLAEAKAAVELRAAKEQAIADLTESVGNPIPAEVQAKYNEYVAAIEAAPDISAIESILAAGTEEIGLGLDKKNAKDAIDAALGKNPADNLKTIADSFKAQIDAATSRTAIANLKTQAVSAIESQIYKNSAVAELWAAAGDDRCDEIKSIIGLAEARINAAKDEIEILAIKASTLETIAAHLPLEAASDVINGKTGSIAAFIKSIFGASSADKRSGFNIFELIMRIINTILQPIIGIFRR